MKTDSKHLDSKLELRRYFLRNISPPLHVLDCCAGDGVIWSKLRSEFSVSSYMGCDVKGGTKGMTVKVDSIRVLALPGWKHNIVDIDVYGSPWPHFAALLSTCRHSVVVFLTWGMAAFNGVGAGGVDTAVAVFMGLGKLAMPQGLRGRLVEHVFQHALTAAKRRGFKIGEVLEAFPQSNARYIGVELVFPAPEKTRKPRKAATPVPVPPSAPK